MSVFTRVLAKQFGAVVGVALAAGVPARAGEWEYTVVYSFRGAPQNEPDDPNALVTDGTYLYGTSLYGGNQGGQGTVFRIKPDGSDYLTLKAFGNNPASNATNGLFLYSGPALDNGVLYGTCRAFGEHSKGTVWRINTDGAGFTVLHHFAGGVNDGDSPYGTPLVSGSTLYGTTSMGGANNQGTVWKMNTNGSGFQVVFSFLWGNGPGLGLSKPQYDSPVLDGSTLYGTGQNGGTINGGGVWAMKTDGTGYTNVCEVGALAGARIGPMGSVIRDGSQLYGTTYYNGGQVFKVHTNGTGAVQLHAFAGATNDGYEARSTLAQIDDTLFGYTRLGGITNASATTGMGVIFSMKTDGSEYAVLHKFEGQPGDGAQPQSGSLLALDSHTLYGTACMGGAGNYGALYKLQSPVPAAGTLIMIQ